MIAQSLSQGCLVCGAIRFAQVPDLERRKFKMLVAPASPVTAAVQLLAAATQWKAESAGPAAYSKFAAIPVSPTSPKQIPSRQAMTIIYAPAFAAAAAALATSPAINGREALVAGMLTAHFAKRLVEVFFVHRYSGLAGRALSAGIGSYYALTVLLITSMQRGVESYAPGLPLYALALYFAGQLGNLAHHVSLARQRNASSKHRPALIFRGDGSRRHRGIDVDIPRRWVAATPRL